jgi:hypothetical protein
MKPKVRHISNEEAAAILRETAHQVDVELTGAIGVPGLRTIYKLANGSALVLIAGVGAALWDSRDELAAGQKKVLAQVDGGSSSWRTELPQQEHFIDAIPELLRALPGLLDLDPAALDFSEASLGPVDVAVRRLGQHRVLTAEIFPSVLAYVGEVIRRGVGGRWELRRDENDEWDPWVVAPDGRECPMLRIYKGLLEEEEEEPVFLQGFASYQIHDARPGPRRR